MNGEYVSEILKIGLNGIIFAIAAVSALVLSQIFKLLIDNKRIWKRVISEVKKRGIVNEIKYILGSNLIDEKEVVPEGFNREKYRPPQILRNGNGNGHHRTEKKYAEKPNV